MTSAAAYMRCSGKASLFGDTWDRQIETIQKCAQDKDLEVIYEFREEAVPGKTDENERPAFQEMIATLLGNGCRVIIVESLDRLAREYRIQEQLIIYLASKQLTLISANTGENITDAMLGDPMRRALVQIQGIFAELDKNLTIAKLRKARERIRKDGRKDNPNDKRCEGRKKFGARDGESEVLRLILDMRAQGWNYEHIASRLNDKAIPTRYHKRWHSGTVSKILKRASQPTAGLNQPASPASFPSA